MGWGLSFKADIYLSKETYNTENEVQDSIDELDKDINRVKRRIALMIASSPDWKIKNLMIHEPIETY